MIDWFNPRAKISKYFTVKEVLYLPKWDILHIPSDDEKANILKHSKNMDKIREMLNCAINVHCWIRPVLNNDVSSNHGQDYNQLVKGAKKSAHKIGLATDFSAKCEDEDCDDIRKKILDSGILDELDMRMEDNPGSNWVHLDSQTLSPGGNRFFKV